MRKYLELCQTPFWREVFEKEMELLLKELEGRKKVLSVGCGPAIIERGLAEHGFDVTGLDVSKEAMEGAPDSVRQKVGVAEYLPFDNGSFDAVIYVASLQFVNDYSKALEEAARVLRPEGMLVAMLLNPDSPHFKKHSADTGSYMKFVRHPGLEGIEKAASTFFALRQQYYLGIQGEKVFDSSDPGKASLYVITGRLS